ncbi:MAG: NAD(P)H-dependent oxidoreductase subunit E [Burkholderiales bacterium]|nr:NAD(P)H-dependent oxidoreductase subunit E [Burkholderiales bacterium]
MGSSQSIPLRSVEREIRRKTGPKGRSADARSLAEVADLIADMPRRRDLLIEYLHRIQDACGQLADRHLVALAVTLNLPMAEVFEVATFYHHFDVVRADGDDAVPAPARLTVRVCESLSCEMAGARDLLQRLPQVLGADVRVLPAPCVGRCEQAPAVVVGQNPLPFATVDSVAAAAQADARRHEDATDRKVFDPVSWIDPDASAGALDTVAPAYCGYATYRKHGGYALLAECLAGQRSADELIGIMESSGLRGLGGAGFPAGRKWRIVRGEAAPKVMAVNIDEGEPGTFKDRTYLERDPHRFLEGMLIAAWCTGVGAIYIYLRDEYHGCRAILEKELARLKAAPPCALPLIELRRGAGAYICGEESAMIESIEGKRGEPRLRPPYVAQVGLFGYPTLEHNFETVYWVRDIITRGADWFASFGRHGRRGLRSFSVSGRVRRPGVHLAPAGISVRELIDEYCGGMQDGHEFYAYLPGGASGGILPASLGDVPLDFDTLQPHGCFIGSAAVIVLSQHDRARDAAANMMRFFADESCGQCTPCRVGTAKAAQLMQAPVWDRTVLEDINQVMADASICGLGQAAPNPIRCVVSYFPHEV